MRPAGCLKNLPFECFSGRVEVTESVYDLREDEQLALAMQSRPQGT